MSGVNRQTMDKAAELFGWAYGLGGFDVAVLEFVTFVRAQSDAQIAELEGALLAEQMHVEGLSTELAATKAQGVVMPERKEFPELMMADYHEVRGWNACLDEIARLNAAPVQQVKCKTCDDNGMIGGPSFYAPDEGGEPCPDCSAHVPQVSAQDGWKHGLPPDGEICEARIPHHTADGRQMIWCEVEVIAHSIIKGAIYSWVKETGQDGSFYAPMMLSFRKLAADPAAPAADTGLVAVEWAKDAEEWGPALNEAGWLFLSELNEDPQKSALIFNNCKGPLRAAIMKYAEIVASHRAKGAV